MRHWGERLDVEVRTADWADAERANLWIVTQNIDDLHERAGSSVLAHLHGSIFALRCSECDTPFDEADAPALALPPAPVERLAPPRCPVCGAAVRPGVVWFGEALPDAAWQAAVDALQACDLLVVIGTSGLVQPAAWWSPGCCARTRAAWWWTARC